jgi:hypothetical protein
LSQPSSELEPPGDHAFATVTSPRLLTLVVVVVVDDEDKDADDTAIVDDTDGTDAFTPVIVPRLLIVFVIIFITLWSAPTPTQPPHRRRLSPPSPDTRAAAAVDIIVERLPTVVARIAMEFF